MTYCKSLAGLIFSLLLTSPFGVVGIAFAQAVLLSATPAANSMAMPAPTELRLKFSEGLDPKLSVVTVIGPGKAAVKTGAVELDPKDNTVLIVALPGSIPDGTYTIKWEVMPTDGHKISGTYSFESMQ